MNSQKYPRTFHLPWSDGATKDDRIADSVSSLLNIPIVISEKMDGSNVSLEYSECYARTHANAPTHPSFDQLKALHSSIKFQIPSNLQLFGEWLFAQHSIYYDNLPGYFLMFNVRDATKSLWLSWEEVELWAQEIGVPTAPVLFKGIIGTQEELQKLTQYLAVQPSSCGGIREGVVVRVASSFEDNNFSSYAQKWVRKNHVETSEHWAHQKIVKNKLGSP